MDNLFLKYMKERSGQKKQVNQTDALPGPVITISREYGCHGKRIAERLAALLNMKLSKLGIDKQWRWISKEILERSAKELKLTPALLKDLSDYKQKSFFENLALFFSEEYYPGDAKIKNTIAKFIHEEAVEGCVIIVGRAGEAITKDIKQSFHVKLEAPLEWRIESVAKNDQISIGETRKLCIEQDKRRAKFRNYFEKDRPDVDFFDLRINTKSMNDDEIVDLLLSVIDSRGFL